MQILRTVAIDVIEAQLFKKSVPDETVEEFYRFGVVAAEEIRERISHLDGKLTSIVGWSAGVLAFILLDTGGAQAGGRIRYLLLVAASSACVAFALACNGLRTRMYPSPSEKDWFKDELWNEPKRLAKFHVISLLTFHQNNLIGARVKAASLRKAEVAIAASTIAVGIAAISRLIF